MLLKWMQDAFPMHVRVWPCVENFSTTCYPVDDDPRQEKGERQHAEGCCDVFDETFHVTSSAHALTGKKTKLH